MHVAVQVVLSELQMSMENTSGHTITNHQDQFSIYWSV